MELSREPNERHKAVAHIDPSWGTVLRVGLYWNGSRHTPSTVAEVLTIERDMSLGFPVRLSLLLRLPYRLLYGVTPTLGCLGQPFN